MANETTAATKAIRQNEHLYWKKKKKMYRIMYQSIPSLTISPLKTSPDPRRLHGKHAKENQTLFTFLTTENLSGFPVHTSANTECIQICPVILLRYVTLAG